MTMTDQEFNAWKAERDKAVGGTLEDFIAYSNKMGQRPSGPLVYEIMYHKCRTALTSIPPHQREASEQWLTSRGYKSMSHPCPYCGSPTSQLIIFPRIKQHIFNYIYLHPGCTSAEIAKAVYGRYLRRSQTLSTHIKQMRITLQEHNLAIQSFGPHRTRYRIVATPPQSQESPNGTIRLNPSLS